jgi:hypothetical protein
MVTGASFYMEATQDFGRNQLGTAKLVTSKDRCGFYVRNRLAATFSVDARPEVYGVSLEAPEPSPEPGEPKRPTWLMEAASKAIEKIPGLTQTSIVTAVGKSKPHTVLAIEALIGEGYVAFSPGPKRAKLHRSVRPYRQATDPKLQEER